MALKRSTSQHILIWVAVILLLMFCLFPFLQILSISLKHQVEWGNPNLIPSVVNLEAYKELLGFGTEPVEIPETIERMLESPAISPEQRARIILNFQSNADIFPFGRYLLNTFLIAMLTAIGSTSLATFAAYSLSRLHFYGRSLFPIPSCLSTWLVACYSWCRCTKCRSISGLQEISPVQCLVCC